MIPPLISYVTFNRMGLTMRNMRSLLKTREDFELHIVDSNSRDNTWDYIQTLNDSRIKCKLRLPQNVGPIYAVNLTLSKRKPEQYFISLDSDVYIHTNDWISRFMRVFDTFPEVGLLGVPRAKPYPQYLPEIIKMEKDGVTYLQLKNGEAGRPMDFVPGHCQCLRPELIHMIGYWSEECHFGDAEISIRVNQFTPFRAGFITDIDIDMIQSIPCEACEGSRLCKLDKKRTTCFSLRNSRYRNTSFAKEKSERYYKFFEELKQGKRPVYCASIHDPQSTRKHYYKRQWAQENFNYYINHAN